MDDRLDLLAVEIAAIGDGFQRRGADRLLRRLGLASCERSEPTLSCVAKVGSRRAFSRRSRRHQSRGRWSPSIGWGVGRYIGWVPPTPVSR